MKKLFSKKLWIALTAVFAFLMAVLIAAYCVTGFFRVAINAALQTTDYKIVPDPDAKIIYEPLAYSDDALAEYERQLCEDLEGEGAALLFNKNNTLPLAKNSKFSCFSQSSVNLLYGGTGSGSMDAADAVTLHSALTSVFGEGCINQDLWTFYVTSGHKRENAATTGGHQGQYRINEVPWSEYEKAGVTDSFASYGDVALVVLARSGGEGADLPDDPSCFTKNGVTSYDSTDGDYLRLSAEEKDMLDHILQYKKNGTFKKVVLLLNSANSLQLDFLDDYDIDAAMWIGDVGMTGINAVAELLGGERIPSGRIVDTFLKDNHSAPAMVNFGAFEYTNADELKLETAQNNTDPGAKKGNRHYVIYQEGIYIGYRYYETRYEDYVFGNGNAGDFSYEDDVAFPFGYGLSYSDFTYGNFNVEPAKDGLSFNVSVDVTNNGNSAAKHTVQIYFSSPYTQYDIDNGVEKASVELCGFDKKEIPAGGTVTYTIKVNTEDLTSYDANGAKTYILDAGDYWFTAGKNAHDAVNNIIRAKAQDGNITIDESKMYGVGSDGTGNASLCAKWTNGKFDAETFAVSTASGKEVAITNRFDNADLNKYKGTADQKITYLSRNNWTGTFPKEVKALKVTDEMWADGLTHDEGGDNGRAALVDRYKKEYWSEYTNLPAQGVSGELNAIDMREEEYDSEVWEQLLSQITYEEMTALIGDGFHLTQPVKSINLPGTLDENGPQGLTASLVGGESAMAYTSEDVMAATFNRELVAEMGKCIGEDFQRAQTNSDSVYAGIYGPGANIHRTPYSGRNFEYYSEDGWLSGEMCAVEVSAIQERGVYVFTKHFALNDQEEGRYGISTWSNEQAIREIYLEGFEGSVVKGGGLGVMSSFNRLGVVWSGAHRGLMTGILREEWGMKGAAITDCSVMASYMDYRLGVLAGQDLWDGYRSGMDTLAGLDKDPAIVSACRLAAKHIIYSVINSHAMNIGSAQILPAMPWWQAAILSAMIVFIVLTAGSAAMLTVSVIKSKKKNN